MKAANYENSPRLQRVAQLLSDGKEHTTRAIGRLAHVCAVNSAVSELRVAGFVIDCQQRGRRWYYRMKI